MENVTYLFGAGASANAIPTYTVKKDNFSQIFDLFLTLYFGNNSKLRQHNLKIEPNILNAINLIKVESQKHTTIDLYANQLFNINSTNSIWKLNLLKCLLSFYLEYLQFYRDGNITRIDPRYKSFFPHIISRSNLYPTINSNIKLLSWNYDNQIELALSNFREHEILLDDIRKDYQIFPNRNAINFENNNHSEIHHVKLNGNSGTFTIFKEGTKMIKNITTVDNNSFKFNFEQKLNNALDSFTGHNSSGIEFSINFGWEIEDKNPFSELAIEKASNIMNNTDTLIVIGYSFPPFNQKIDKLLLSMLKASAKIRYQTIDDNSEVQENKIRSYLSESKKRTTSIKHICNDGNFLLPHEI